MIAAARERGLDVAQADARAYLQALPDASLGGVISSQVIEHLEPSYLIELLPLLFRKLRPAAPIVLETINPACWLAFFSSYLRDFTHVWPVHPDTLQYLLQASGFARVEIRYTAQAPDSVRMRGVDPASLTGLDPATARALTTLADAYNANATILNSLLFTYMDYAAIGYRT
jgi:O-antigen chain-terminating methyltransferase